MALVLLAAIVFTGTPVGQAGLRLMGMGWGEHGMQTGGGVPQATHRGVGLLCVLDEQHQVRRQKREGTN